MRGRPGCIRRYMLLAHAQSRCVRIMRFVSCASRYSLYDLCCTMCAVPFAMYHLRRIMRVVTCGAVEVTRSLMTHSGSGQRQAHGTVKLHSVVHSPSGVKRSLLMCFSASPRCTVPTVVISTNAARAHAQRSRKSGGPRACQVRFGSSKSHHGDLMAIRFGSTSFPPGCWDGDRPIGRRGSGAPFARGLARRGRRVGRSSVCYSHLLSLSVSTGPS
jgi:hypothetical protein